MMSVVHNIKYLISSVFPVYSKRLCVMQVIQRRVIELKMVRYVALVVKFKASRRTFYGRKGENLQKSPASVVGVSFVIRTEYFLHI